MWIFLSQKISILASGSAPSSGLSSLIFSIILTNFANPYGGQNGFGFNDPSVQPFGCGCATPDVAAANPVIGSGGSRAVQLGLKLIF
jgi:hypothetical protein